MTQRNKAPAPERTRPPETPDPRNADWKAFEALYRPIMAEYMAENHPDADAEGIIRKTLLDLAGILPHYRHLKDGQEAFRRYLPKVLSHRAGGAPKARAGKEKRAAAKPPSKARARGAAGAGRDPLQVSEEDLAAAREWFALRDAVAWIALQELENSTSTKMHYEVFCRICLAHEKPAAVAESLGISLANAYQVKKRMLDRFRATAKALFGQVGM
jgi:hypothetical protein